MRNRPRPLLRDRCVALLDELDFASIAGRATMTDLRERLEAFRRRPIHLIPVVTQLGSPTGMWIATASADYIFHVSPGQTSAVHAVHCTLHEAGHILLGHSGNQELTEYVRGLCQSLSVDPATPIMLRTEYQDDSEYEAEFFATLACGLVGRVSEATYSRTGGDPMLYTRLAHAFADGPLTPTGDR